MKRSRNCPSAPGQQEVARLGLRAEDGLREETRLGEVVGVVEELTGGHRYKTKNFKKQLSSRRPFAGSRLISDDRAARVCSVVCAPIVHEVLVHAG